MSGVNGAFEQGEESAVTSIYYSLLLSQKNGCRSQSACRAFLSYPLCLWKTNLSFHKTLAILVYYLTWLNRFFLGKQTRYFIAID